MALEKEVYRAFEDIVGPEYISDAPAILASYTWRGRSPRTMGQSLPKFEAIVLPQSTQEVQAIVRLCNRHKLQFKASSTGWGPSNSPGSQNVVQIDLRRMNRIIEIDEKNLHAVIEPYVIGAQLQAELMKRGFNVVLNGAGAQCAALPTSAATGHGFTSIALSYSPKNVKAVEWVAPDGEIIKLGSLGSVGEWFCGDGPGPSLKGLIRSATSPAGGMGVFTKASMKIYHWPGPAAVPLEGVSPRYAPAEKPAGFMIRFYSFKSVDDLLEAARKICESEIPFQLSHPITLLSSNIATDNYEDMAILERFRETGQGPGITVMIAGNSQQEFEYKRDVLEQIINETAGKSFDLIEDPKVERGLIWRDIRCTTAIRETGRARGSACGTLAGHGSYTLRTDFVKKVVGIKKDLINKGLVFDENRVNPDWDLSIWPFENGHIGYIEVHFRFERYPETLAAIENMWEETFKAAISEPIGVTPNVYGDKLNDLFGPSTCNYNVWLRKIKQAFDPNGAAESSRYVTAQNE